jgi:hypothetical protein
VRRSAQPVPGRRPDVRGGALGSHKSGELSGSGAIVNRQFAFARFRGGIIVWLMTDEFILDCLSNFYRLCSLPFDRTKAAREMTPEDREFLGELIRMGCLVPTPNPLNPLTS